MGREQGCRLESARAFTLVEVLIVTGIIALLASLLLPALAAAKRRGRGVACLSNAKELVTAWILYADDHSTLLPPNTDGVDHLPITANWVGGTTRIPTDITNTALLMDPSRTLLAPYLGGPRLFKCPGDRSRFVRSYSMNCRLNPTRPTGLPSWVGGVGTNFFVFRRTGDLLRPSATLVVLDERPDTINDPYFAIDMSNTGTQSGEGSPDPFFMIDYPASNHGRVSSVSFGDGHVEPHRWRENTTCPAMGTAEPSHTSPSDLDAAWLQDHATQAAH